MTIPPAAILFDLDGTLVDSLPDIHASVLAAYREHHCQPEPTLHDIARSIGQGVDHLVEQLFSMTQSRSCRVEDMSHTIRQIYQKRLSAGRSQIKTFPQAETVLHTLSAHYPLAIVTNRPEDNTRALIQQLGWTGYFSVIIGQCVGRAIKPKPDPLYVACQQLSVSPRACILIGDSLFDQKAAAAIPMPFFWARYGYWQNTHPFTTEPACILDQLSDVLDCLPTP